MYFDANHYIVMKRVTKRVPATTNNITRAIINFLIDKGHFADRVNRTGIYDPRSGQWRKSNTKNALFDIYCCLGPKGESLWIDVKKGKDTPSKAQYDFKAKIEACGGKAEFITSYQQFKEYYEKEFEK
jgi:hypothetical protein